MPVFLITYASANQHRDITNETEWITPGDYDSDRARLVFEGQFPSASVLRVQEVE